MLVMGIYSVWKKPYWNGKMIRSHWYISEKMGAHFSKFKSNKQKSIVQFCNGIWILLHWKWTESSFCLRNWNNSYILYDQKRKKQIIIITGWLTKMMIIIQYNVNYLTESKQIFFILLPEWLGIWPFEWEKWEEAAVCDENWWETNYYYSNEIINSFGPKNWGNQW